MSQTAWTRGLDLGRLYEVYSKKLRSTHTVQGRLQLRAEYETARRFASR